MNRGLLVVTLRTILVVSVFLTAIIYLQQPISIGNSGTNTIQSWFITSNILLIAFAAAALAWITLSSSFLK